MQRVELVEAVHQQPVHIHCQRGLLAQAFECKHAQPFAVEQVQIDQPRLIVRIDGRQFSQLGVFARASRELRRRNLPLLQLVDEAADHIDKAGQRPENRARHVPAFAQHFTQQCGARGAVQHPLRLARRLREVLIKHVKVEGGEIEIATLWREQAAPQGDDLPFGCHQGPDRRQRLLPFQVPERVERAAGFARADWPDD